jgi:hypothetical protein
MGSVCAGRAVARRTGVVHDPGTSSALAAGMAEGRKDERRQKWTPEQRERLTALQRQWEAEAGAKKRERRCVQVREQVHEERSRTGINERATPTIPATIASVEK